MMRQISFMEPVSGLAARCDLLEDLAPLSCNFLWQLAERRLSFEAIHAIWTGPELSCPLPAALLPDDLAVMKIPEENATSFPASGEIALAALAAGSVKGLPSGNFFDIGLFYGPGGRLLMPFGWIKANICARIVTEDLEQAQLSIQAIRRKGACKILIAPVG